MFDDIEPKDSEQIQDRPPASASYSKLEQQIILGSNNSKEVKNYIDNLKKEGGRHDDIERIQSMMSLKKTPKMLLPQILNLSQSIGGGSEMMDSLDADFAEQERLYNQKQKAAKR